MESLGECELVGITSNRPRKGYNFSSGRRQKTIAQTSQPTDQQFEQRFET